MNAGVRETGLVGSELAGIARKTVNLASQIIVNILEPHGTSLQPAEAADKLRELEDKIWEEQKCINEETTVFPASAGQRRYTGRRQNHK